MPIPCSACVHPQRKEIDLALVRREAYRKIASTYNVGREALRRHAKNHLPELLERGYEAEEAREASDLLTQAHNLHRSAKTILSQCEDKPSLRATALRAVRETRGTIELLRRVHESDELEMRLEEVERLLNIESRPHK